MLRLFLIFTLAFSFFSLARAEDDLDFGEPVDAPLDNLLGCEGICVGDEDFFNNVEGAEDDLIHDEETSEKNFEKDTDFKSLPPIPGFFDEPFTTDEDQKEKMCNHECFNGSELEACGFYIAESVKLGILYSQFCKDEEEDEEAPEEVEPDTKRNVPEEEVSNNERDSEDQEEDEIPEDENEKDESGKDIPGFNFELQEGDNQEDSSPAPIEGVEVSPEAKVSPESVRMDPERNADQEPSGEGKQDEPDADKDYESLPQDREPESGEEVLEELQEYLESLDPEEDLTLPKETDNPDTTPEARDTNPESQSGETDDGDPLPDWNDDEVPEQPDSPAEIPDTAGESPVGDTDDGGEAPEQVEADQEVPEQPDAPEEATDTTPEARDTNPESQSGETDDGDPLPDWNDDGEAPEQLDSPKEATDTTSETLDWDGDVDQNQDNTPQDPPEQPDTPAETPDTAGESPAEGDNSGTDPFEGWDKNDGGGESTLESSPAESPAEGDNSVTDPFEGWDDYATDVSDPLEQFMNSDVDNGATGSDATTATTDTPDGTTGGTDPGVTDAGADSGGVDGTAGTDGSARVATGSDGATATTDTPTATTGGTDPGVTAAGSDSGGAGNTGNNGGLDTSGSVQSVPPAPIPAIQLPVDDGTFCFGVGNDAGVIITRLENRIKNGVESDDDVTELVKYYICTNQDPSSEFYAKYPSRLIEILSVYADESQINSLYEWSAEQYENLRTLERPVWYNGEEDYEPTDIDKIGSSAENIKQVTDFISKRNNILNDIVLDNFDLSEEERNAIEASKNGENIIIDNMINKNSGGRDWISEIDDLIVNELPWEGDEADAKALLRKALENTYADDQDPESLELVDSLIIKLEQENEILSQIN